MSKSGYKTTAEYMTVHSSWKHQTSREGMWLGSFHATSFPGRCTVLAQTMPLEPKSERAFPTHTTQQHPHTLSFSLPSFVTQYNTQVPPYSLTSYRPTKVYSYLNMLMFYSAGFWSQLFSWWYENTRDAILLTWSIYCVYTEVDAQYCLITVPHRTDVTSP